MGFQCMIVSSLALGGNEINPMKIILLKNVDKLGRQAEIKDVSVGYARNYLFPRGLADMATPDLIAQLERRKEKQVREAEKDLLRIERLAEEVDGKEFEMTAKASETGSLYAAITKSAMCRVLEQHGYEIPKEYIAIDQIKTIGEHKVPIRFPHGIEASISLLITSAK